MRDIVWFGFFNNFTQELYFYAHTQNKSTYQLDVIAKVTVF